MPHGDSGADPAMTLSRSPRYVATVLHRTALVLRHDASGELRELSA